MDKPEKKKAEPEEEKYWIYEGERRPVVVQAKNARHAAHKVSQSSEYDGFPIYVTSIEDFARRCQGAKPSKEGHNEAPPLLAEPIFLIASMKKNERELYLETVRNMEEALSTMSVKTELLKLPLVVLFEIHPGLKNPIRHRSHIDFPGGEPAAFKIKENRDPLEGPPEPEFFDDGEEREHDKA